MNIQCGGEVQPLGMGVKDHQQEPREFGNYILQRLTGAGAEDLIGDGLLKDKNVGVYTLGV